MTQDSTTKDDLARKSLKHTQDIAAAIKNHTEVVRALQSAQDAVLYLEEKMKDAAATLAELGVTPRVSLSKQPKFVLRELTDSLEDFLPLKTKMERRHGDQRN